MSNLHLQDDCELIFEEEIDQRQEDGRICKQLFYMGIERNKPNNNFAQQLLDDLQKEIDK